MFWGSFVGSVVFELLFWLFVFSAVLFVGSVVFELLFWLFVFSVGFWLLFGSGCLTSVTVTSTNTFVLPSLLIPFNVVVPGFLPIIFPFVISAMSGFSTFQVKSFGLWFSIIKSYSLPCCNSNVYFLGFISAGAFPKLNGYIVAS